MRKLFCLWAVFSWVPIAALAQSPPTFTAQYLGAANHITSMNEAAIVVGWVSSGNVRGFVAGPDRPYELLPLPLGMVSSFAEHINDTGEIVGAVGPHYSPEYFLQGRAVMWTPDGSGGWTVSFLGQLPGHVSSMATSINNVGDIVGYSFNGMYRLPVLFAPGGPVDLSATGIFDPCDVNDQRVVVDQSFTAKKLDLNTMIVDDLGVPSSSYIATRAQAINNAGTVAGAALLATSTNCDHQAARHGKAGWEILSGCGQYNSAYDINALGDVVMQLNVAVWVNLIGIGTHPVEDLISPTGGPWFVINSYGNAINTSRQIALLASNPSTGQSGVVLLTPEGEPPVSAALQPAEAIPIFAAPNPFDEATTFRFSLDRSGRALVTVHDVTGRLVRMLSEGFFPRGMGSLIWDGRDGAAHDLPSGVYFARISTDLGAATRKVVKVK